MLHVLPTTITTTGCLSKIQLYLPGMPRASGCILPLTNYHSQPSFLVLRLFAVMFRLKLGLPKHLCRLRRHGSLGAGLGLRLHWRASSLRCRLRRAGRTGRRGAQPLVKGLQGNRTASLGLGASAARCTTLEDVIPARGRHVGGGEGRADAHGHESVEDLVRHRSDEWLDGCREELGKGKRLAGVSAEGRGL